MFKFFIEAIIIILLSYPIVSALNAIVGFMIAKFIESRKYNEIVETNEKVSILVPVKNEEEFIEKNITYLCNELTYKNYEVIAINDNSIDESLNILTNLQTKFPNLKVLNLTQDCGKSKALNIGVNLVDSEYVLVCDADTIMQKDAIEQYLTYFVIDEKMGAVSGNISIENHESMIEKSQVVEFTNLLGLIKRTNQHVFRRIFTLSGANAMYRKQALFDAGLFRLNRNAEDIAVTLDLQLKGWKAHFAPKILFYTSVPHSWNQLFKQRLRWAKGGLEVWISNTWTIFKNPLLNLGLVAIWIDYFLTFIWSISFFILLFLFSFESVTYILNNNWFELSQLVQYVLIFVHFQIFLGFIQIILAISIDSSENKWKYVFYIPLYILFYWVINPITLLFAFIPSIKNLVIKKEVNWDSPNRK